MMINESAENYLETILILSGQLPVVRSVDIATELNFKKSSVSVARRNYVKAVILLFHLKAIFPSLRQGKKLRSAYTNGIRSLVPG